MAYSYLSSKIEQVLEKHKKISWDIDGTFLDSRAAPLMHRYVLDHPEKDHYIVTFRSHGWEGRIFDELAELHRTPLPSPHHFKGIINIPDDDIVAVSQADRNVKAGARFVTDADREAIRRFQNWKGLMCHQRGITILVDDMPDSVLPGCDRYGILHVHPDDLL